jgi:hypothetical protein
MYLGGVQIISGGGGGAHPPAPPENLCLPDSIDRKDILFGSFIRVREEWLGKSRGGIKKK